MNIPEKRTIRALSQVENRILGEQQKAMEHKLNALRELISLEESRLSEYRSVVVKNAVNEVTLAVQKRNALVSQISSLVAIRTHLLSPLYAEWKKLCIKWQEYRSAEESMKEEKHNIQIKQAELSVYEAQLNKKSAELLELQESVRKLQKTVENDAKSLAEHQKSVQIAFNKRESSISERELELKNEENRLAEMQKDVETREAYVMEGMAWVRNEKIHIESQRAQLIAAKAQK